MFKQFMSLLSEALSLVLAGSKASVSVTPLWNVYKYVFRGAPYQISNFSIDESGYIKIHNGSNKVIEIQSIGVRLRKTKRRSAIKTQRLQSHILLCQEDEDSAFDGESIAPGEYKVLKLNTRLPDSSVVFIYLQDSTLVGNYRWAWLQRLEFFVERLNRDFRRKPFFGKISQCLNSLIWLEDDYGWFEHEIPLNHSQFRKAVGEKNGFHPDPIIQDEFTM